MEKNIIVEYKGFRPQLVGNVNDCPVILENGINKFTTNELDQLTKNKWFNQLEKNNLIDVRVEEKKVDIPKKASKKKKNTEADEIDKDIKEKRIFVELD